MPQWFLELSSGVRVNLARGLTSIGRSSRCDIVVPDPSVSRRQVLLYPRADAVELINVGKQPLAIDGEVVTDTGFAREGSSIQIAGTPIAVVRCGHASHGPDAPARWCLRLDGGPLVSLPDHPFTIGGSGRDDLVIAGWAPATLTLHGFDTSVMVEAAAPGVAAPSWDAPFDEGGLARLEPGQELVFAGVRLELVASDGPSLERSTMTVAGARCAVRLERFKSGGMLTLERGGEVASVYLARRRYALARALLAPLERSANGYQSVDALCLVIWPDDPVKDRTDFNVLLYRVRRDLIHAGIDPDVLIDRERGSGMIRAPIVSLPNVEVRVE